MAVTRERLMPLEVAASRTNGVVVTHTHWDREWYQSFELFRMRLVDLIDLVLATLDQRRDFHVYTLDGQTVMIEDYLQVRPENEDRVRRHVASGRLQIGPWYVLADGFLASAETMVRNLLVGRTDARRMGGEAMPVGYLPDNFGHPSQMPQLLRGFGYDAAVVWRGITPHASEFEWEAPDGSRVVTEWLADGYCAANVLSASPMRFMERMGPGMEKIKAAAKTPFVLVMNGCDHQFLRPDLPDSLRELNPRLEREWDLSLRQGSLPEFMDLVRASRPEMEVVRGELREVGGPRLLPGVISSRMYLKQENYATYTMLERGAEPLAAAAWLMGDGYPEAYFDRAWRLLLQNSPHDSITGCSIDRVHRDMLTRYASAQDIARAVAERSAAALARRVAGGDARGPAAYLTFNTLPFERRELVRERVHFIERAGDFHVTDSEGRVVPTQVVSRRPMDIDHSARMASFEIPGKEYPVVLAIDLARRAAIVDEVRWRRFNGEEVEVLVQADLPAVGYATFNIEPGRRAAPVTDLSHGPDWAENALVRLEVRGDGTFDILDKRTGARYARLGALESGGDRGDEYTFCPPEHDEVVSSQGARGEVAVVEEGPLRVTFEIRFTLPLPRRLSADRAHRANERASCPVVTRVSLSAGRERVEVRTQIDNRAEDHRLRAVFPAPLRTDMASAEGQFAVDRRPVARAPRPIDETGMEQEVFTFPHKAFVDVSDGRIGLAVLDRGLPEYEAEPDGEGTRIALTLLRCVGWLSRPDLRVRPDEAGGMHATPEAQCQGRHVFEYAVVPHAGSWLEAGIQRQAQTYTTPVLSASLSHAHAEPGPRHSFVSLGPSAIAFSALKRSEEGDRLVLRCWNASPDEVEATAVFAHRPSEVHLADLAERPSERLAVDGEGRVRFRVRPFGIVTLLASRDGLVRTL